MRDVADFVQEQRTLIGHFEAPNRLRDRSGEGAFLMTEQFAFQKIQRDSRAIQFYKGPPIAPTCIVNSICDEFLSSTGFPLDEDGRISSCNHFDLLQHLPERGTLSHNSLETRYRIHLVLCAHHLSQAVAARVSNSQRKISIVVFNWGNIGQIHGVLQTRFRLTPYTRSLLSLAATVRVLGVGYSLGFPYLIPLTLVYVNWFRYVECSSRSCPPPHRYGLPEPVFPSSARSQQL